MRKLISVLVALALVGSVAAQKGKKAAKPAAPAVAAPKVPAMPAAVTAAPVAAKSGKGMGLFIEGFGLYALGNGSSTSAADGDVSASSVNYKLSGSAGFGGGGAIGYQILENLGLVASFQYRSIKTREWSQTNQSVAALANGGSTTTAQYNATGLAAQTGAVTINNTKNTMIVGLGLRPTVNAGPGAFYAGAGVALVLPYDDKTTTTFSGTGGASTISTGTGEKTQSFNLAIGGYAELGYMFSVTDNLYIGIGGRMVVATANDSGKDTVYKITGSNSTNTVTVNTTTTGAESVPSSNAGTATGPVTTGTSTTSTTTGVKTAYASQGITDIAATVTVGFRF